MNLLYKPGDKLSLEFLNSLKNFNKRKNKESLGIYKENLRKLFGKEKKILSIKHKRFLGGFILGEGSINLSIKRNNYTILKVTLDPQFSVTQHINGSSHLLDLLELFQTGRISHKAGSNATLVYAIDSRKSIEEKVLPFWKTYILPFQDPKETYRFTLFEKVLKLLNLKKHHCPQTFAKEILPLWDVLRKQKGQHNETFESLEQAQHYVLSKEKV